MEDFNKKFEAFDVVRVPFPFSDLPKVTKERPALVLSDEKSFGAKIGHSVLGMITSAENSAFPLDILVADHHSAGLPKKCIVRMKLFTVDNRIILERVGKLGSKDRKAVQNVLRRLFPV